MGRTKKIIEAVVDVIKGKTEEVKPVEVKVTKTIAKKESCTNCTSNGEQCYICTPVFEDTFA